jgi:V/A-type H+-transporting ATPase subunit I
MMRPLKMKRVEITALERDVDTIIKFLGKSGVLQFSYGEGPQKEALVEEEDAARQRAARLEQIKSAAHCLEIELAAEPGETTECATEPEDAALAPIIGAVSALEKEEYERHLEKERLEAQLRALSGFENLASPLAETEDFSFLNLKIGRLDPQKQNELRKNMGGRAIVVPLSAESNEVLVASSRKGRFSLDSELEKQNFSPAALPKNLDAPPEETIRRLTARLNELPGEFERIEAKKDAFRSAFGAPLSRLYASYLMSALIADIKERLISTKNAYILRGWLPARSLPAFVSNLENLTQGRISVSCLDPWEVPAVRAGKEKIPVSLSHGRLAKAFEPLVFSYGAPLYGTIDPTPVTAFFFTLLFAIMFGDVGQGFVLALLGIAAGSKRTRLLTQYRHFSGPLKLLGAASMLTGFLYGSVFSNEELLHKPTEFLTGALSRTELGRFLGIEPSGAILNLMPHADNMEKIFLFFGATLAVGALLNSIGLLFNIVNKFSLHEYEKALFSKSGAAGLVFFWYSLSLAVRALIQKSAFSFRAFDAAVLAFALFFIVFGHLLWRLFTARRPLLGEGLFAFIMEGIVEILETLSGYISNTVSFLRVGAFALSHAVLSFIIWTMADKVREAAFGSIWSLLIIVFGNLVIIFLEGMIVAIQVTRLQYYEFFSKFFTETGAAFRPFRFRKPD